MKKPCAFAMIALVSMFSLGGALTVWHHCRHPVKTYTRVDDGLYVGGAVTTPPPGTQAVLNVCEWRDPYRTNVYEWEPILDDDHAPDIEWINEMVAFIDAQRAAGRTTFVHCHAGISRSGMVVVAYEMAKRHMTCDQALAFIRTKRPQIEPNPAFMARLHDYQHYLHDQAVVDKAASQTAAVSQ